MLQSIRKTTRKGDCEASHFDGLGVNVETTLTHGNMWLCSECLEKELVVDAAKQVIETSRHVVSEVELKQDLFNLGTVPLIAIQAAIEADDSIPADKKAYAVLTECAALHQKLTETIFAEEAATLVKRNARHALTVNMQSIAATLHERERAKWIAESKGQYEVNYKPHAPKVVKPKVVRQTPIKFDKAALYEAAKKYNITEHAHTVRALVLSKKHATYDDAAKHLAGLMGLI